MCNVAQGFRDDTKSIMLISWPPRVDDLEKEEEFSPLMVELEFLSALRRKKGIYLCRSPLALTSLIIQYLTK